MANKLVSRPSRKKSPEAPPALKTAAPSLDITIDYPKEEELIVSGHYAVRISAMPEAQVELSINDAEWAGCRTALGFLLVRLVARRIGRNCSQGARAQRQRPMENIGQAFLPHRQFEESVTPPGANSCSATSLWFCRK